MTFASLDLNKTYTYADYYSWDFDNRVELINGKVFEMMSAPTRNHQKISGKIYTPFSIFLMDKPCEVYYAPFDVRLPTGKDINDKDIVTVLQPDVCVICDPSKLDDRGCLGAPDLVVEILSPGNTEKELRKKYEAYETAGVKEYWVVSPQYLNVFIFSLNGDKFVFSAVKLPGDTITTPILPGFSLVVSEIFAGLPTR